MSPKYTLLVDSWRKFALALNSVANCTPYSLHQHSYRYQTYLLPRVFVLRSSKASADRSTAATDLFARLLEESVDFPGLELVTCTASSLQRALQRHSQSSSSIASHSQAEEKLRFILTVYAHEDTSGYPIPVGTHVVKVAEPLNDTLLLWRELLTIVIEEAKQHYQQMVMDAAASGSISLDGQAFCDGLDVVEIYLRHIRDALSGSQGPCISYLLTKVLPSSLNQASYMDRLSNKELATFLRNVQGLRPEGLFADASFRLLVAKEIDECEEVVVACLRGVEGELEQILLAHCSIYEHGHIYVTGVETEEDEFFDVASSFSDIGAAPETVRFAASDQTEAFSNAARAAVKDVLLASMSKARGFLTDLLAMEKSVVLTNDSAFYGRIFGGLGNQETSGLARFDSEAETGETDAGSGEGTNDTFQDEDVPVSAIEMRRASNSSPAKSSNGPQHPKARNTDPFNSLVSMIFGSRKQPLVDGELVHAQPALPTPHCVLGRDEKQLLQLLGRYMAGVKRGLADSVAKAISHLLVKRTLEELPRVLYPLALAVQQRGYKTDHTGDAASGRDQRLDDFNYQCHELLAILRSND